MVKNAKRICVAICFGSSNNLTGLYIPFLLEGSNMIFHSLTFARSLGKGENLGL